MIVDGGVWVYSKFVVIWLKAAILGEGSKFLTHPKCLFEKFWRGFCLIIRRLQVKEFFSNFL